MCLQTRLFSFFLLALIAALYVDASILHNKSAGRGGALPLSPAPSSKAASPLVDITNTTLVVRLDNPGTLTQSEPEKILVPAADELNPAKFKELMDAREYGKVIKIGKNMQDDEFLHQLCPAMTTTVHFRDLFECLECRGLLAGFLVHGRMQLVAKTIIEFKFKESDYYIQWGHIHTALAVSLSEDRHDRAVGILQALQSKYAEEPVEFKEFIDRFIEKYAPEQGRTLLKSFLSLRGQELIENHPLILEILCESLFRTLRKLDDPYANNLLIDLVGQIAIITPKIFNRIFLIHGNYDINWKQFVACGWREVIEESWSVSITGERRKLWSAIANKFQGEFSGVYPPSEELRTTVFEKLPTKKEREDTWAKENAPNLLAQLDHLAPKIMPRLLLGIVAEYAITWTASGQVSSSAQLIFRLRDSVPVRLKKLTDRIDYKKISKFVKYMPKDRFLKHLYPAISTVEQYKGISGHLKHRDLFPGFLVHGDMMCVRKAITTSDNYHSRYYIKWDFIHNALILSFKEAWYERAADLVEAVQAKYLTEDEVRKKCNLRPKFELFMDKFFRRLARNGDSMSIRRFLVMHGEQFKRKHPIVFDMFCTSLVYYLKLNLDGPNSRQLLIDFVAQPDLLTPTTFANGVLTHDIDSDRRILIECSWREAIEEGLREEYPGGGTKLWAMIIKESSVESLPPAEIRSDVLKRFRTKQELEMKWVETNTPHFVAELEKIILSLPTVVLGIISEYTTITWLSFERGLSPIQPIPRTNEQIREQIQVLMSEKRYYEVAALSEDMETDEFLECVYPSFNTFEEVLGLFDSLDCRDMLIRFVMRGRMEHIRTVIVEGRETVHDHYIDQELLLDATILSLKNGDYDRVVGLLGAAGTRFAIKAWHGQENQAHALDTFTREFFESFVSKDCMPLKRFLCSRAQELREKYPDTMGCLYQKLASHLVNRSDEPKSEKLLVDLIGQPFLLTSSAFEKALEVVAKTKHAFWYKFVTYGWKEIAVKCFRGWSTYEFMWLWDTLKEKYPNEFRGECPSLGEACVAVLTKFPTKQGLEEAWLKENTPRFLDRLEKTMPGLLRTALWSLVFEYAIPTFTWLDV